MLIKSSTNHTLRLKVGRSIHHRWVSNVRTGSVKSYVPKLRVGLYTNTRWRACMRLKSRIVGDILPTHFMLECGILGMTRANC